MALFIVSATHSMADHHVGRSSQAVRAMVIGNVGYVTAKVAETMNEALGIEPALCFNTHLKNIMPIPSG
jgi:hypothetical protein